MIRIIITAYGEPKATEKAVNSFLEQELDKKIKKKLKILVVDPFPEVGKYIKTKFKKHNNVEFYRDPGEGKSYVLNVLLSRYFSKKRSEIFIFTDGDVYVSPNAVSEILNKFKDQQVGCVTAHPVSLNSKRNMFGYWSHFLFSGIDRVRARLSSQKEFFECSGYLFAIRNGIITDFPIDCSEDSIIPALFWNKGYKIAYARKAFVYVLNPQNLKDWKNQKIRNIKGHEKLNIYFKKLSVKRTKSFFNEIKHGLLFSFKYPRNLRELYYTFMLYFCRLYIYYLAFRDKKREYQDGWRETKIESTRPLD